MRQEEIDLINEKFRSATPEEIVKFALSVAKRPIVTTNFKPKALSILHLITLQKPDIPVIWIDSGYNTSYTYKHALESIKQLNLNIDIYVPKQSVAFRNLTLGIPEVDTPQHQEFTQQVKLEPFKRAIMEYQPDVWFTNLRRGQTEHRNKLNILHHNKDGILKVCPFFHWTDDMIENYMLEHDLKSEERYYDPTKVIENRECGLHL